MSLKRLSDTIPAVTSKVFQRKYIALGRIVTQWEDIVGEDAKITQPIKIHYRKAKNKKSSSTAKLDVATTSANATTLHYKKDLILEKINRIFGDNWITDIDFIHVPLDKKIEKPKRHEKRLSPVKEKNLSDMLENIEDPDIKSRLMRFGTSFLKDKG